MREDSRVQARWLVTAAFLLFVISLVPSLGLQPLSGILPLASPLSTGPQLDLAAMALTPLDLDDIGLTGFGQQTSALLDLEEQVAQYELTGAAMPNPESDAAEVRAALTAAGFQRRYQRQ